MTLITRKPLGYSKVDKEDSEEVTHRRAKFLIYKAMEQADSRMSKTTSFVRMRMWRLKIKIGRRSKKMRRSVLVSACKQIASCYKACKALFGRHSHGGAALPLPSLIT